MSQQSSRRTFPTALLLLVLLLAATTLTWRASQSVPTAHAASTVSALLWGTNLTLTDQNDLFLTNPATSTLTQQLHVQMVRFPDRGNLAVTTAAAKEIQTLHLVPLLILHYGSTQVSADQALIQMMNSVFGTQTVYYEYGNEMDLQGIDATAYTASWNTVIAQLQPLAQNGKFIGPVTYQANPTYVGYFVQHASPQPFGVSWHEYTCNSQQTDQYCLSHIDNWTAHIQATRQAMGKNLPILITEYNWNPNPAGDPRASNPTFQQQWMQHAISVLGSNQVFAANQYVLTNNAQLAMISDSTHTLTGIGLAFQTTFEQAMVQAPTATATGLPTMTPSVTTTSTPPVVPSAPVLTSTPTVTPSATAVPSALSCFQVQAQGSSPPQDLCVPALPSAAQGQTGPPVGTLCFLTSAAPAQAPPTSTPAASATGTVCLPVYEQQASSVPTATPTPVATAATNTPTVTPTGTTPSSTPTAVATKESTPTALFPTAAAQPSGTPLPVTATPFIGS